MSDEKDTLLEDVVEVGYKMKSKYFRMLYGFIGTLLIGFCLMMGVIEDKSTLCLIFAVPTLILSGYLMRGCWVYRIYAGFKGD